MKRAWIWQSFGRTSLFGRMHSPFGACIRVVLLTALGSVQPCLCRAQKEPVGPGAADRHLNRGIALLEKQEVDAAIAEFKAAINVKPNFAAAFNAMGLALERKGEGLAAVESFRKATELDPTLYTANWRPGRRPDGPQAVSLSQGQRRRHTVGVWTGFTAERIARGGGQ